MAQTGTCFRDLHKECFVCGENNPCGLRVDFRLEDGGLTGIFTPRQRHQVLPEIVHGGIISSLLDGAMAKLLLLRGTVALTARLRVSFKRVVNTGDRLKIRATLVKQRHRLFIMKATLLSPDGTLLAEATGTFLGQTGENTT